MPRNVLSEAKIHPAIREKIASYRTDILKEVQAAVAANEIVVVGMRQNPFPKKARKLLDDAALAYKYLEYGSYLGEWRRRLALKMWTGWPTFPMVFVKGVLIGGASDLAKLIEGGELPEALARRPARAAHPRGAVPRVASAVPRARAERRRAAREQAAGDLPRRERALDAAPRRARKNRGLIPGRLALFAIRE